ncbi:MAG TPA: alpha/beta fold hydrolase [Xanthobacteraceae bacterium]|jgi:dipeptidyl aminopeptidase/acylaminoacyl peptidase|nr:alpha/beta fold hydrolase [Xanthobacteraceae bacterium]
MQTAVSIPSDGLKLSGVLHVPDGRASERLPAFLVLHGFIGSKDESHAEIQARMLEDFGYAALRFDFRGCGDSEGRRGYVLCMDQVADTRNALTWLAQRPEIDPARIGVIGHSFGAAVAVYTAGTDERVAAVISSCGWGHGERKFRGQHPGEAAWKKFTDMLARNREHKKATGESLIVSRWDVVPIPEHLRRNLPSKAQMELPADTAQSMYDFRAEEVVGNIAPRPLMLLHTANDQVTPTEQSIRMFEKAGMPTELYLITGESHFPLAGDGQPARSLIKGWLDRFFPLHP